MTYPFVPYVQQLARKHMEEFDAEFRGVYSARKLALGLQQAQSNRANSAATKSKVGAHRMLCVLGSESPSYSR